MNAIIWGTHPVCYFHFRLFLSRIGRGGGSGGGSDGFVWVFLKGHALIHSKKWEGHEFFRKKILKYPGPPPPPPPRPPNKKRTFPRKKVIQQSYWLITFFGFNWVQSYIATLVTPQNCTKMLRNLTFVVQFAFFSLRPKLVFVFWSNFWTTFDCFFSNFWATFWEITGHFLENLEQLVESLALRHLRICLLDRPSHG